jgi:hypothetical protein
MSRAGDGEGEVLLEAVARLAFRCDPAAEANLAIAQVREQLGGAASYELILPGDEVTLSFWLEKALPRLVYFLQSHGAKLPHCEGVFVSLFLGEELLFIHARDVVGELAARAGLSSQELVQRYGG